MTGTPRRVPSTDGVTLALHDLGGRGAEILYSHATGFHGRVWVPLAAELADRYHGWAPDYRGHGDSNRPDDGEVVWLDYGDDCLAVLDAIGPPSPLFGVGHSKGGVSLLMAERARPGAFAALALYEPVIFPTDLRRDDPSPLVVGARRRRAEFPSFEAAIENFAAKPPMNVLTPAALDEYVRHGFEPTPEGTVRLKCEPEHEARTYEGGGGHGAWDWVHQIRCPVLIMAGDPNDPGPGVHMAEVTTKLPNGRFLSFDRLGHFGPLQDPPAVASAIATFFAEVRGA